MRGQWTRTPASDVRVGRESGSGERRVAPRNSPHLPPGDFRVDGVCWRGRPPAFVFQAAEGVLPAGIGPPLGRDEEGAKCK